MKTNVAGGPLSADIWSVGWHIDRSNIQRHHEGIKASLQLLLAISLLTDSDDERPVRVHH